MIADYRTVVLDGDLSLELALDGDISFDLAQDGESGVVTEVVKSDYPFYTGDTVVDPDFVGRTLETAQKVVVTDIQVNPIQVESVSNPDGGRTVYIGGII